MTQTKIETLAQFCEASHLDPKLIRAVVRQFGGWSDFTNCALDVCRGGIDGGFHGFIYTTDTEAFAKRNRALIAKLASEQAQELGSSVFEMIRNFGCFRHYQNKPTDEEIGMALYAGQEPDSSAPVLNALAWYAGEEVCRSYENLTEN